MKLSQFFLFKDVTEDELEQMKEQDCMKSRKYTKNEIVFCTGDLINEVGLVLSGSVIIENIDLWGNRSILSRVEQGEVFAETYALCQKPLMIDAVCYEETEILFINLRAILDSKNNTTTWYHKILKNILIISVNKNLTLSTRIFCTASKSVRSRVMTFLSAQAVKNDNMEFTIPFNRQQMADYLNLDRSALSKELCRMRDEGILSFRKNKFKLYKIEQ